MAALAQSQATAAPVMTPSSHPYTCNTCQIALKTSQLQRVHHTSDWHRYNLKRRVASLPPLTSEVFAEKVLANKASAAETAARASFERRCEACDKTYYSEGAHSNHLGSQKHKILVARFAARGGNETESMTDSTFSLGDPLETASSTASTVTLQQEDAEAEEEFEGVVESLKKADLEDGPAGPVSRPSRPTPSHAAQTNGQAADQVMQDGDEEEHTADPTQCLFCNYKSPEMDLNLTHMSRQHGFFVPEKDYLVDLPGLVNYLSETINVLHTCLYCHKAVHTASGVQTHMRDRGHCMIAYSTQEEQMDVGEFYDFRSTYSDEETDEDEEMVDGGVSLGAKRAAKTTTQGKDGKDVDVEDDDEGWESESSLSSVPTDEITSVPVEHREHQYAKLDTHRHHSRSDPRPHKNTDGFHSHAHHTPLAVYHDEYELHLPTGRTAGHRSLRTYYRQNLRNYPTAEERAEQRMIEDGRHDSDADDDASEATETNGADRGRNRQLVSRANGGLGMVGVSEAKKREVKAIEKRDVRKAQRAQNRYQAGNEKQNNFQKHFRDPLLQ